MSTTLTATTKDQVPKPRARRRRRRYLLTGLAVFAATIALFYLEENWRGRRVWEDCKRALEAKGAKMDWDYFIPAMVPDDQNIFAAPIMENAFVGRGSTVLSQRLNYSGKGTNTPARIVIAKVTIGLPGSTPPAGFAVVPTSDTNATKTEATRLMIQALDPVGLDPSYGETYTAKKLDELKPALIFLRSEKPLTAKEVERLVPFPQYTIEVVPTGENSYSVTMPTPSRATDYVAWADSMAPVLSAIRQAVERPFARLPGDYSIPSEIPIPNFVTMRTLSQRLSALAQCYMLLGQREKALDAITFMHRLCRLLEARPSGRPMTLVAAMINVAIAGLYVDTIQDGMRLQIWQEPQLAALETQLGEINLRPYVGDAMAEEQAGVSRTVEVLSRQELVKTFWIGGTDVPKMFAEKLLAAVIPRGWIYQNMAVFANLSEVVKESFDATPPTIEPRRIEALTGVVEAVVSRHTPFNYLVAMAIPNTVRAGRTLAHNQTKVNQARMVCALERYRLARGEYPITLAALTPQYIESIPPDLIGGQPPHYHRTDDGKFILYSIGWTEKDHGGHGGADMGEGDWVWGAE